MFRAEIRWFANGPILIMEGSLDGDWAEQARFLAIKNLDPKGLIVDLTEVTYVDSVGEQLLNWLGSVGAEFVAKNIYALGICERLHLPVLERRLGSAQQRSGSAA